MAAPVKPGVHNSLQMDSFWIVPTVSAIPTDDEINSASGLYITCFLTEENSGWTVQFNKGTSPRLLCSGSTNEVLLPSTATGTDLIGVVDPQAAEAHADKEAFEFLRDGLSNHVMVRRQNKANNLDDQATAGEFVDYVRVDITPAVTDKTAVGPEGVYVFKAGVAVTGDPVYNVAVAAAP
jgi:hypothetical protein